MKREYNAIPQVTIYNHWEETIRFKYTHFKYLPKKDQGMTMKALNDVHCDVYKKLLTQIQVHHKEQLILTFNI